MTQYAMTLGHTCIVCQYDVNAGTEDRYYDLIDGTQANTKLIVCSTCFAYIPALNAEIARVTALGTPAWTNDAGTEGIVAVHQPPAADPTDTSVAGVQEPTEERARMQCVVCGITHPIRGFTVCGTCSDALREGVTLEVPRTYMLPNRVDTVVSFRLNTDGDVEWMFPDDGKWAVCSGHAQLDPGAPTPYTPAVHRIKQAASIALLALCLLTSQHASAAPTTSPDIAPAGCTITHAWEDGSRIATCQDGKTWTYDPDGLGPACPKTSAHYTRGWHTAKATRHAQHACTREIRH